VVQWIINLTGNQSLMSTLKSKKQIFKHRLKKILLLKKGF